MSIKLITLNIEGDKHLDLVIPFLQKEQADVVCLQEVYEADMSVLSQTLGMQGTFAPMSTKTVPNPYNNSLRGSWGSAFFTHLPHSKVKLFYYKGTGSTPIFHHPYDNEHALLLSTVEKDGEEYVIATTHFTWSPDGHLSTEQQDSFDELKPIIVSYPNLIFCGDFNAPRGRELFNMFSEVLTDNLPQVYTTTIDNNLHKIGNLELVVDTIFSRGKYVVSDVRLVDGVSDHMAVVGVIETA